MPSHTTDWFPGRVRDEYREGWDRVFVAKTAGKEQGDSALEFFKHGDCCGGNCDCSNRKQE